MENIIKSILEIDQQARDKIAKAERERNRIIADAKAEEEQLLEMKIKEADDKLAGIKADEQAKADVKLAEIEAERDSEIKRLNQVFEEKHEEWQEKIFKAIIGS